jgi:hypothetical protein
MTTAPVGCLDGEQAIRDALAAGPTPGPWIAEINSIGTHVFSAAAADVYPRNIADLIIPFWAATDPDDQHGVRTRVQADTRYIAACNPESMRALLAELDRLRSASRQEGWQPIADAPEDVLLVVGWLDAEDEEHPERHDFDYLEDGIWQKHSENVEYFQVCAPAGSRGPREQAPYTHFMPVGSIPAAPHQAQEAQGDRHGG